MSEMTDMGIAVKTFGKPEDIFDEQAQRSDAIIDKMTAKSPDGTGNPFKYTAKAPSLIRYGSPKYHEQLWQCLKNDYLQTPLTDFVDQFQDRKKGLEAYRKMAVSLNQSVTWWREHTNGELDRQFKEYTQGVKGLYSHREVGTYGSLLRRVKIGSPLYEKIKPYGYVRPVHTPMNQHDWETLSFNVAGYHREGQYIYFLGSCQKLAHLAC